MAAPRTARGFTLVELLVVITIIGMLVSLLLPAIQAAREAGRRTTCMNNMGNVAKALVLAEQTHKGFPGYANMVSKGTTMPVHIITSWVVPILPALEQSVLYQNWMDPTMIIDWDETNTMTYNKQQYIVDLPILRCPSNASPDLNPDALSFAVNTGSALLAYDNDPLQSSPNPTWPEDPASGVMFNQSRFDYPMMPSKRVTLDFVSANDGSTNTLLVSENLQTGGWATSPFDAKLPFRADYEARQCTGLLWFLTGNRDNTTELPMPLVSNFMPETIGINDLAQAASGLPRRDLTGSFSEPNGLAYCRPSSYHPGGVNAMFCSSNARFIAETIDYKVYTQLLTSRQTHVIVDYSGGVTTGSPIRANYRGPMNNWTPQGSQGNSGGDVTSTVKVPWGYILDDADL